MSSEYETMRMNPEDNLLVLLRKYNELLEKVNQLYRRDYILEMEVDSLHAECRALRLRIRELEDEKEKRSGSSRPNF